MPSLTIEVSEILLNMLKKEELTDFSIPSIITIPKELQLHILGLLSYTDLPDRPGHHDLCRREDRGQSTEFSIIQLLTFQLFYGRNKTKIETIFGTSHLNLGLII